MPIHLYRAILSRDRGSQGWICTDLEWIVKVNIEDELTSLMQTICMAFPALRTLNIMVSHESKVEITSSPTVSSIPELCVLIHLFNMCIIRQKFADESSLRNLLSLKNLSFRNIVFQEHPRENMGRFIYEIAGESLRELHSVDFSFIGLGSGWRISNMGGVVKRDCVQAAVVISQWYRLSSRCPLLAQSYGQDQIVSSVRIEGVP